MLQVTLFLLLGLLAGAISGLIGIGGGIIIVPILVLIFGFSEHIAQGTTLALMIPPIGILAAYEYYEKGFINWPVALFVAAGFVVGGFLGSKLAVDLSDGVLQKIFGITSIAIGLYMIFKK